MTRKISLLAVILCLTAVSAWAISGDEVYSKHRQHEEQMEKAMGGFYMRQLLTAQSEGFKMVAQNTIYHKGNKMRLETEIKSGNMPGMAIGQKTITIDDGQNTWIFSPMLGKVQQPSQQDAEDLLPQSVKLMGEERIDGISCYVLQVEMEYDEQHKLWIDKQDFKKIKEASEGTYTRFSDFRKIKGYSYPGKIEVFDGSDLVETMQLEEFELRASISESLFDPKQVKGFDNASPMMQQQNSMQQMMELQLQIQQLYSQGKQEEAKALEQQMQNLMQGMGQ